MPGIVCAVRGGPHSKPTIDRAIALAKENDLSIFFLYVVNLDFLSRTSQSWVHTITKELEQMGEFILLSAQQNAIAAGVNAEAEIRRGNVGEEIITLSREKDADYVVLGRPQVEVEENVFTHQRIQQFSERIAEESGAKVVFSEGGEE